MATLERNGERMTYYVTGSGPPLVLGHSLLCGGWMWDDLIADLSKNFTVINTDFRGHGSSTANRPFTLDDLASDWLALLDHLGHRKAIFCGLSMGAMTAMRLALRAPDRVSALILMDTSADPELRRKRVEYGLLTALYSRLGFNDFLVGRIAPIMLGKSTLKQKPERIPVLAAKIRQHPRQALIRAIQAVVTRDDICHRISDIRCPSLILIGEEDKATPPFRSRRIHERISGSSLVSIPAAGHLSAWEQPERVGHEISGFLGALRHAE